MSKQHIVSVNLPHSPYVVHIQAGALGNCAHLLENILPNTKVAIIADSTVLNLYSKELENSFSSTAHKLDMISFDACESNKNYSSIEKLYSELLEKKFDRGDSIIAFGGGVAGDVVGFVAASFLRGLPFVQVPTTLLSMVDASVGGKVGYNNSYGKNLIGAFYQPKKVIIDPLVLESLPQEEFVSGLAECAKHAILDGEDLFSWIEANYERLLAKDSELLSELIARNVNYKASIVLLDEKEKGQRALLNLGHTFAHALESESGYGTWLHGQAVSLGILAATKASTLMGLCNESLYQRIERLLENLRLPTKAKLPEISNLVERMSLDKKVHAGSLRLVLPHQIGDVQIHEGVSNEIISKAWGAINQ